MNNYTMHELAGKTCHDTYNLKDRVLKVKDGGDQETSIQYDAVG